MRRLAVCTWLVAICGIAWLGCTQKTVAGGDEMDNFMHGSVALSNGQPAASARVRAVWVDSKNPQTTLARDSVLTNASGEFKISNAHAGLAVLLVDAQGESGIWSRPDSADSNYVIHLGARIKLVGRIDSCFACKIQILGTNTVVTTDAQGDYTLDSVAPGRLDLDIQVKQNSSGSLGRLDIQGGTPISAVPALQVKLDGSVDLAVQNYAADLTWMQGASIGAVSIARDAKVDSVQRCLIQIHIPKNAFPDTLLNFPLLVRATPSSLATRFYSADGRELPYQVESSSNPSEWLAWVLVPQIMLGDTVQWIEMRHSADYGLAQYVVGVFDTSFGYLGVWHLDSSLANATGWLSPLVDSNTSSVTGVIGDARLLRHGHRQFLTVHGSGTAYQVKNTLTVSVWGRIDSAIANWDAFVVKSETEWRLARDNATAGLGFGINAPTSPATNSVTDNPVQISIIDGTYHYLVGQKSPDSLRLFVDGRELSAIANADTLAAGTRDVTLGRNSDSTRDLSGALDEPRIERIVRSPGWIWFSYENQKLGSSLITIDLYPAGTR